MSNKSILFVFVSLLILVSSSFSDEFFISRATMNQKYPSSASCGGDFFVAWEDDRGGTTNQNIFGQLVLASGTSPTAGYAVVTSPGNQISPAVGVNEEDYLIVWVDQNAGVYPQLFGRLFNNEDAEFSGATFQITTSASSKSKPVVTSDGSNFLVLWQDVHGEEIIIKGLRVSSSGAPLGSEITVSSESGKYGVPAAASNGSQYIVVFRDSSDYMGISAKFISTDGVVIGEKFPLATGSSNMNFPSVTWDGVSYFATWQNYDYTTYADIYCCKIKPDGEVFPGVLPISTIANNQANPSAVWANTAYLIAWQDDRGGIYTDIYCRWLSWNGELLYEEIIICSAAAGQQDVTLSWNGDQVFAAWGDYRNGFDSDVYGYLLDTFHETPEGPLVYNITPSNGAVTACDGHGIKMFFADYEGVNETSILFFVNGTEYGPSEPEMWVSSDSLAWWPVSPLPDGDTIFFELTELDDIEGNPLAETISGYFIVDLSPPYVVTANPGPGDTVDVDIESMRFTLEDASSIDPTDFWLQINDRILDADYPFLHVSDLFIVLEVSRSDISLTAGETLNICLHASDLVDYCDAHILDTCWVSYVRTSGIDENGNTPGSFKLLPNYPNPFNERTTVRFQLADQAKVNVSMIDINGNELGVIYDGFLNGGYHEFQYDLEGYPSGIYFISILVNCQEIKQKVLLLK